MKKCRGLKRRQRPSRLHQVFGLDSPSMSSRRILVCRWATTSEITAPCFGPSARSPKRGVSTPFYAPDYTATRVMSLPACEDLGGENPDAGGFCPVDYWVASDPALGLDAQFGLVAGCVWGDDSSWKIQFLDLSKVAQGVVVRDERLGYLELADGHSLDDVVEVRRHDPASDWAGYWIEVQTTVRLDVESGRPIPSYDI